MIILDKIWGMTVNGSLLILLILLIRYLFRWKISRKVILFFWGMACFILIVPIKVTFPASATFLPQKEAILFRQVIEQPAKLTQYQTETTIMQPISGTGITPKQVIFVLYLIGLLLVGLFFIYSYYKSIIITKQSIPITDQRLISLEKYLSNQLRKSIAIKQSDRITSPAISGTVASTILVPSWFQNLEDDMIKLVLTHEMIHIQRRDSLKKVFVLFVLWLHWFNPLVWLMYRLYNNDIEIVCDKVTLDRLGKIYVKKYAYALIRWQTPKIEVLRFRQNFSESPLKERVELLVKNTKKNNIINILMTILVVGACVVLISNYTVVNATTMQETSTRQSTSNKVEEKISTNQTKRDTDYTFKYIEKYQKLQEQVAQTDNLPSTQQGLYYEEPTKTMIDQSNSSNNEVQLQADSFGLPYEPGPYYVNRKKQELTAEEISLFEQLNYGVVYLKTDELLLVQHPDYENPLEQHCITYTDGTALKTSFVYDSKLGTLVMIINEDYAYGQGHGIEVKYAVNDSFDLLYEISEVRYG